MHLLARATGSVPLRHFYFKFAEREKKRDDARRGKLLVDGTNNVVSKSDGRVSTRGRVNVRISGADRETRRNVTWLQVQFDMVNWYADAISRGLHLYRLDIGRVQRAYAYVCAP